MTPAEIRAQLATYADGECDAELRAVIEAHLAANPDDALIVERWRALRRCVQRSLSQTPVPADLAARVQSRLAAETALVLPAHGIRRVLTSPRIYRAGAPGLAAAAVVILAFTLWPRGASATQVDASAFASVFRHCGLGAHDALGLCAMKGNCRACVRSKCGIDCALPEFDATAPDGFELAGGCACTPSKQVHVVHAFYREKDSPQRVVSFFATDRPIRLCNAGAACTECPHKQRCYRAAANENVAVVSWNEDGRTYVLCGQVGRDELLKLADEIRPGQLGAQAPAKCDGCESGADAPAGTTSGSTAPETHQEPAGVRAGG